MYYKKLTDGFNFNDEITDGSFKYYLYLNDGGIVLIIRENTSTGELRYCIKKGVYATVKSATTTYDYFISSSINL